MKVLSIENHLLTRKARIQLPPSKSISNRLLIMQALSEKEFGIQNLSQSGDTQILKEALFQIYSTDASELLDINIKDAGTPARFLTALMAYLPGNFILRGSERMQERPMTELVEALRKLGADIQYLEREGFLPLKIGPASLKSIPLYFKELPSSQFISALLLIAPYLPQGLKIHLSGNQSSKPYIAMTTSLMKQAGVEQRAIDNGIHILPSTYELLNPRVGADWSSAAFFYQTLSLMPSGEIFFPELKFDGLQGDEGVAELFEKLGISSHIEIDGIRIIKDGEIQKNINADFSQCPDIAQAFISACAAHYCIGKFSGLESLHMKESDRIEALIKELAKFNFQLWDDGYGNLNLINACQHPKEIQLNKTIRIQTYKDHRVAMSMAPLSLLLETLEIENPDIVKKSFPDFWREFAKLLPVSKLAL